jgi:hypothetical protein
MRQPSKRLPRKIIGSRKPADVRVPLPDGMLRRLAGIVRVLQDKLGPFRSLIRSAQAEAFRSHGVGRRKHLTSSDVRPHFARLRKSLEALQPERKGYAAGIYLDAVIAPQSIHDWLDAVARAERHAMKGLPGRGTSKGPRAHPGFVLFTTQIVIWVKVLGGELKCQRMNGADYDKVKGSFADLLDILRDYLPDGFIPNSAHSIAATFDRANKSAI